MARSEATKPSRAARMLSRHGGKPVWSGGIEGLCACQDAAPADVVAAGLDRGSTRKISSAALACCKETGVQLESAIGEPPRRPPTPPLAKIDVYWVRSNRCKLLCMSPANGALACLVRRCAFRRRQPLKSAFIRPNQRDASFFACVRRRGRFSLFRSPTHPLSPCCLAKQAPLCACYCPPCFLPPNSRIVSEALVKERFFRSDPGREGAPFWFFSLLAGRNRRSARPNSGRSPLASRRPFPTRRPNAFDTPSTAHSRSCCLRTPGGPLPEQAQPHPASLPAPYRCRLSPCALSQASARSVSGQTRRRRLQNLTEWLRWTRWATSCAAR